jgi:hypothetical protein
MCRLLQQTPGGRGRPRLEGVGIERTRPPTTTRRDRSEGRRTHLSGLGVLAGSRQTQIVGWASFTGIGRAMTVLQQPPQLKTAANPILGLKATVSPRW